LLFLKLFSQANPTPNVEYKKYLGLFLANWTKKEHKKSPAIENPFNGVFSICQALNDSLPSSALFNKCCRKTYRVPYDRIQLCYPLVGSVAAFTEFFLTKRTDSFVIVTSTSSWHLGHIISTREPSSPFSSLYPHCGHTAKYFITTVSCFVIYNHHRPQTF
jgi:hypothetical protein